MNLDNVIQRFNQKNDVFDQNGNKLFPSDAVIMAHYAGNGEYKVSVDIIENITSRSEKDHYVKLVTWPDYVTPSNLIKIDDAFFNQVNSMKENAKRLLENYRNAPKKNYYVVGYYKKYDYEIDGSSKKIVNIERGIFQTRVAISTDGFTNEDLNSLTTKTSTNILNRIADEFRKNLSEKYKETSNSSEICVFPSFQGYGGSGSGIISGLWARKRRNRFWYNEFDSKYLSFDQRGGKIKFFTFTEDTKPFKQDPNEDTVRFVFLGKDEKTKAIYDECIEKVKKFQGKAPKTDSLCLTKKIGDDKFSIIVNKPVTMKKKFSDMMYNTTVNPVIIALIKAQIKQYPENNFGDELSNSILNDDYSQYWYEESFKRLKQILSTDEF